MKWDVAIRKSVGAGAGRFDLDVAFRSDAERLVVFGPSGAGKTLTLKAIAGLLRPDAGHVRVDGTTLFDSAQGVDTAARRRGCGYLFQEYALFPHLTARQNIAFGLDAGWRNPGRDASGAAVERWLDALELRRLASRFPDQLSGGQRQRVALARALAARPGVVLLDEPFGALDAITRGDLQGAFADVRRELGVTTLLVTHDLAEAARLAESVAVMRAGRVEQCAPLATLAAAPATDYVAALLARASAAALRLA